MSNNSKLSAKEYRLANDRSGEAFILKVGRNGKLLVFDQDEKRQRAIRHAPNEKSIYLDDQSTHAYVTPIIFYNGYLTTQPTETKTQEFLDAHPDNVANGGGWFEVVDDEFEASEEIEVEEIRIEAKQAVRAKAKEENGVFELEAVVAAFKGSVVEASQMQPSELKRYLYQEIDTNPYRFVNDNGDVNIFDDVDIKMRHITLRAIADGVIQVSPTGKSMMWASNKEVIVSAPAGVKLTEYFAANLQTDEGMLILEEIQKRS